MNFLDLENLTDFELDELIKLVHQFTGITMNRSKRSLIQGRIRPRLREIGLGSYKEYLSYLKSHTEEKESFIDLCTTNETYFFRTTRVWDFFENDFLKKWISDHPNQKIKIWSGASSSGEEVYSLGVACEKMRQISNGFSYEIIGSDISNEILQKAIEGKYQGRSIDQFRKNYPEIFDSMMKKVEGEYYSVNDKIKKEIKFQKHNLFDLPFKVEGFDIVFLRNVLIYFKASDQEKVLKNIYKSMKKDALLIVGESESLTGIKTDFKYVSPLIYRK